MALSGVYIIEHTASGRMYVGSAINLRKRWDGHVNSLRRGKHHGRYLQRCWDKYGEAAFVFRVALYCDPVNLLMYEQALIDFYQPAFNTNPTAGSMLGFRMSDESKARLSAAAKRTKNFTGHRHSEESKRKISESRKGKGGGERSIERRANISAALKGRSVPMDRRARIAETLTGRIQSAETIEKRVKKIRGRKFPVEFGLAISARLTGRKLPPSHCENIGRAAAALSDDQVICIRQMIAQGLKQKPIADRFGVDKSVISEINCGKTYRWVV